MSQSQFDPGAIGPHVEEHRRTVRDVTNVCAPSPVPAIESARHAVARAISASSDMAIALADQFKPLFGPALAAPMEQHAERVFDHVVNARDHLARAEREHDELVRGLERKASDLVTQRNCWAGIAMVLAGELLRRDNRSRRESPAAVLRVAGTSAQLPAGMAEDLFHDLKEAMAR